VLGIGKPALPAGELSPDPREAAALRGDVLLRPAPDLLGPREKAEDQRPDLPLCLLLGILLSDRLPVRVRKELQSVVQLLQCYLRAAELEMRAAEEPLKGNLDVAGLKAQVLERIEMLEEREREREQLLAELIPAMEAHGYNPTSIREVLDR
jgi:hypothetical protein